MERKTLDLRNIGASKVTSSEIPPDTEVVLLSGNQLNSLPVNFFYKNTRIMEIDLSSNNLTSLRCLSCFTCLEYLDISGNNLELDDLISIKKICVIEIKTEFNSFVQNIGENPYMLPALLSKAWIINGQFITDFEREQVKFYKTTMEFGEIFLNSRRQTGPTPIKSSSVHSAKEYIHDIVFKNAKNQVVVSSTSGSRIIQLTKRPQVEKLFYLANYYKIEATQGDFIDYFGVILGLLSHLWTDESLDLIPRLLCRAHWYVIQENVKKLQQWELLVLLYCYYQKVHPTDSIEQELWKALNAKKYVEKGKIPLLGSTPRLMISAFISRGIAFSTAEATPTSIDDLRAYLKFRKSCGFTELDSTLSSVYQELIAPFYVPSGPKPSTGDTIELVHPVSGDWVKAKIIFLKNGRVYSRTDDDVVSQLPGASMFWDGRGVWREAARKEFKTNNNGQIPQIQTFITAADIGGAPPPLDLAQLAQSFAPPPPATVRVAPADRNAFLQLGRETMRSSPFIRTSVDPEKAKYIEKWRLFRGIVEPPCPGQRKSSRAPHSARKTQTIHDVVNVVQGLEYIPGRKLRKFSVKIFNPVTGKYKYDWINEADISDEEAEQLMILYREHIATKMSIVEKV